ncbi:FeoA family protein [Melioribacter roseus P3M-2]|jgi:ferrous iron transport protein A|uniref:FeoA family protein n=2 Tax=Melioribacteraceae TaxID=1334117 RepID=I7A3U7_MELRP|nr:FeoA family protein [Melioribacter roseus P3M-2]
MNNITLDKARKGNLITIVNLPGGEINAQLIRIGISEGETLACLQRLPGGTIILQKNRQEIAVGYDLAKNIKIILR